MFQCFQQSAHNGYIGGKLNSSNYGKWAGYIKVVLLDRGSWSFIDGTKPALDTDATSKERRDHNLCKDCCYSTMFLNVEEALQALISTTCGKKASTILKNHFEPINRAQVAALLHQFFNARKEPDESIGVFIECLTS
ncbi:DUF4219 domain-containing protein [Nephila pilipes]|uniref:DUF4219 domain-containing protein n=1 Tax=Nephila pilipes TaxID=299642 RepID=A0A8X6PXP1_NEPPI|nr:DUF4219 domain-containing protein [Nephila pilipes]